MSPDEEKSHLSLRAFLPQITLVVVSMKALSFTQGLSYVVLNTYSCTRPPQLPLFSDAKVLSNRPHSLWDLYTPPLLLWLKFGATR